MKIHSEVAFIISIFYCLELIHCDDNPRRRGGMGFKSSSEESSEENGELEDKSTASPLATRGGAHGGSSFPSSGPEKVIYIEPKSLIVCPTQDPFTRMKTKPPLIHFNRDLFWSAQDYITPEAKRQNMRKRQRRIPNPDTRQEPKGRFSSSSSSQRLPHTFLKSPAASLPARSTNNRYTAIRDIPFGKFPTRPEESSYGSKSLANFPQDEEEVVKIPGRFFFHSYRSPFAEEGTFPREFEGKNFCMAAEYYSEDFTNPSPYKNGNHFHVVFDEVQTVTNPDNDQDHNGEHRASRARFACETEVIFLSPAWVHDSVSGEWMTIVDSDIFPQKIRTELCLRANKPCSFVLPFHDSTCQQRYSLHRFVAVHSQNASRRPVVLLFKFPAGCSCRVDPIPKRNT